LIPRKDPDLSQDRAGLDDDEALRLVMADNKDERSLAEIAKRCGFGGMSQFSRAFRARFGAPPRQYRALVRQQDLDWHEARLVADGFDKDALLWRHQGLHKSAANGTSHAPVRAANHQPITKVNRSSRP
jgi:hypothetical protein